MLNVKDYILGLLIVLISLGACKQEMAVPPTTLPTRTLIATEMAPSIPPQPTMPSSTSTPVTTPTQPNVPTETPTEIAVLQFTPTPYPTATPLFFDLPEWVTEPSANILLLDRKGSRTIIIYNVETKEQYNINIRVNNFDPRWLWQESRYFLSPQFPNLRQEVIDVMSGEFVKLSNLNPEIISPDGRYAARIITQEDRLEIIAIIDFETGAETELFNPFLNLQSLDEDFTESATAYWSPDGAFLSVRYSKRYYSGNSDQNLVIYTPSGEIFRQYTNIDTSQKNPWASVLPYRILYTERYVPPCILEVIENNRTCLEVIDEWSDSQSVTLFNYIWSPDGNKISYVYGDSDLPNTGLCYFELATQDMVCPVTTNDLQLDEQLFARIQFWSPDGKYLVLFFDEFGFIDVVGNQGVAVVDIDSQTFMFLEGEFSFPFSNPWRPPILSQTDE